MKAFLKENSVIVAGIALPLLLTAIFFASTLVTQMTTEDPKYSFLYTKQQGYSYPQSYRVIIKDEKAFLSYIPPKKDTHTRHEDHEISYDLYIHDPETGKSTLVKLPEIKDKTKRTTLEISELSDLTLSSKNISPDGYHFGRNYNRSGNLMTEVFSSGGSYDRHHKLSKGQKSYKIPDTDSYNIGFIGWVLSEE